MRISVVRLVGDGLAEHAEGLLLVAVCHEPVAEHHLVVDVARMLVRQLLQRFVGHILVAFQLVGAHLRYCRFLACPFELLNALDGAQHVVVVAVLVVELQQYVEHIAALGVVAQQVLVGHGGLVVAFHARIESCQQLVVCVVVGI